MIRFPNRLPGRIPSRTHRTTVAAETSSSFATCFVVMYLFVMFLNLSSAIYTSGESSALGAASEFAALWFWMVAAGRMFPFENRVSKLFPFRAHAKSWGYYGFQRCFQCFHICRRVLKEK